MAPQKSVAISWLKKNLFAKLPESMIATNKTLRDVREHITKVEEAASTVSYYLLY
jgi:hypothetical protein